MAEIAQDATSEVTRRVAPSASTILHYATFQHFVERAADVFGDESKASLWLSTRSHDLNNRTPLEVAQDAHFDPAELTRIFEPLFVKIEHGIYY